MVTRYQQAMAFALVLAACASQPVRVHSALPPKTGQLAVSLANTSLHRGVDQICFAIIRAGASSPQTEDDPQLSVDVRFFENREPRGVPDAHARASFVNNGTVACAGNAKIPTNWLVELPLRSAGGGNLQFVIMEPNGSETVIGMPVRVAE